MLKWEKIEGYTRLITRTSESVAKRLAQGYRSGYGTGLGHRRTVHPKSLPRDGCVCEPLKAKRLSTCTGTTRRLWGWLGQAWVASSELEL